MKQERLMRLLLAPHVSEKATKAADRDRQVVFKVVKDASKPEIKQAVETLFKVEVESVQVLRVKGKRKRFGRSIGQRSDWKKAYVQLKPGHDIEFVGSE